MSAQITDTMRGLILPGNSTAELREFAVPAPGHGEVLVRMKSSTICGSDIRCIYHQHLGKGPEGYQPGMIAGHEPCGQIVACGPGCRRFACGDRVIVYHISGCGVCNDCRRGYMISCTSQYRRAYGWQRDGGMADYLLAEEKDLVALPDSLSYSDGAQVACGFGTVYEGIERVGVSGNDAVLARTTLLNAPCQMALPHRAIGRTLPGKAGGMGRGPPAQRRYGRQSDALGQWRDRPVDARRSVRCDVVSPRSRSCPCSRSRSAPLRRWPPAVRWST